MASTTTLLAALAIILVVILGLHQLAWLMVAGRTRRQPAPQPSGTATARAEPVLAGLSPATTIVTILVLVVLLGGLTTFVVGRGGQVGFDQAADDFFRPYRAPWLLKTAEWVTAMGAGPSLAAILATATALLWSGRRVRFIAPLWIAFLGAQATTWTAKYIIARPRPAFLPGITEWNPSFPSGHATATTALVGMLGLIVGASLPGIRARFETGFWTVVLVGLICFSRIFLGVHFVTDVAAGLLVGAFWLVVGYTVGARRMARHGGD